MASKTKSKTVATSKATRITRPRSKKIDIEELAELAESFDEVKEAEKEVKVTRRKSKVSTEVKENNEVNENTEVKEDNEVKENTEIKTDKKDKDIDLRTLFRSVGNVEKPESTYEALKYSTGLAVIDIDDVNACAESMAKLFLSESGVDITDEIDAENRARYKLVNTGLTNRCGETIYASFVATKLGWSGAYIGTFSKLRDRAATFYTEKMEKFNYMNKEADEGILSGELMAANSRFCSDIFNMLWDVENWSIPLENGKSRLVHYFLVLKDRVIQIVESNCGIGYITNIDGNKLVFNSGLLDKYMNDIYIICTIKYADDGTVKLYDYDIVRGRTQLLNDRFNRDDIKTLPEPVKFYTNKAELIFDGDICDIDLEDRRSIEHIISERISRFPVKWQSESKDLIYDKIVKAIENGVKLQKRDYKYIVPMYNVVTSKIQYLFPLYLDSKYGDAPELVLIVSKVADNFYNLKTILRTSDAYDNARVVAVPSSCWLRLDK